MSQNIVKIDKNEARIAPIEKDDPFYSESNLNELRRIIKDIQSGKANLTKHVLIEVDD